MSIGKWASDHPWMTFFLASSAIGGIASIAGASRGSSSVARYRRYGADYVGPGSPNYDYSTPVTDVGLTYTDPAVYQQSHVERPWGGGSDVIQMDPLEITGSGGPPSTAAMLGGGLALLGVLALLAGDR